MNLSIVRGTSVVSPMSAAARKHAEPDFEVELTDTGRLVIRSRGGAPFVTVDTTTRECTVDVLNVPHIDVGKRKADQEKTKKAADTKK